ncbi:MAG: hypothetical protein HY518_05680 [Candidatus Aenigmarchaeota archaeon]|nr:hypothetical protein [Candidatus Aenigmarchaeota archaeon]
MARNIARTIGELPPWKEGHAWVIHKTTPGGAEKIAGEGFNYARHYSIDQMAWPFSYEDKDMAYAYLRTGILPDSYWDARAFGNALVVMDMEYGELAAHQGRGKKMPPGLVPRDYVIGIISVSE